MKNFRKHYQIMMNRLKKLKSYGQLPKRLQKREKEEEFKDIYQ